jgi:hypothetical protein
VWAGVRLVSLVRLEIVCDERKERNSAEDPRRGDLENFTMRSDLCVRPYVTYVIM